MRDVKPALTVQIVILLTSVAMTSAQQASVPAVEDCLDVRLSPVGRLVPAGPTPMPSRLAGTLAISLKVDIRDPIRILATTTGAAITRLVDAQGRDVTLDPRVSRSPPNYETPKYQSRRVRPPSLPRWRRTLQTLLRLRPRTPQVVRELVPNITLTFIKEAPLRKAGGEIQRLEGYIYALTADSVEYVDVPFEPNSTWIRLTPDQEVRVVQAQSTESSCAFEIEERTSRDPSSARLAAGHPWPSRVAIARQLLDDDGNLSGAYWKVGKIAGKSTRTSVTSEIKTIRFVIAINPKHNRIPFVFEHIPLPKP